LSQLRVTFIKFAGLKTFWGGVVGQPLAASRPNGSTP